MLIPILLQQGPLDEFLKGLPKLIPVIIFIGAIVVSALKQARDKQARKEASQRSLERTWEQAQAEMKATRQPAPPPTPNDLEQRVRRYFENVAVEQPTAQAVARTHPATTQRPAPLPARPSPPKRTARKEHRLVEIEHMHVDLKHLDVHLQGLQHKPRGLLPSRMKSVRGGSSRKRKTTGANRPSDTPTLKRMLSSRGSLRKAILLREILGPPKGLED